MQDASIFIIDDEDGIVRLCTRLLERANFKVSGNTDPQQGIETLRSEEYDLLLVDIRMPGMDGFEVMEIVRQLQTDIAVVIMTGFGTLETAIRALRQGADGLILKPFEDGSELVKTVKEALKERQHKQEVARLHTIRPLLSVTESLFSETRLSVLVELVLNSIVGHLHCDHAAIYQRDPGDGFLKLLGKIGRAFPEEHARASGGYLARTAHWKVPIWINIEGPGDPDLKEILAEHTFSAVISVPIERGEGSLVFMAARSEGEVGFQLVDLEMFGLLARQADVALENARLYGALREYVKQIELSQRALIQAEKMSAVGRLTASIAHEVNNPLQAVQNCLHLAGREELSEDKRTGYLTMAGDELERLMGTVQRMLDFYRPGARDRKPTDIEELINRVFALLEKQMQDQDVWVAKDFADNLPQVNIVSNQIQQVFFNLVLNSLEVMKEGGEIEVRVEIEGENLAVYFKDNGPGISPDVGENIFEPFMSSREDGTGLGLSVSYGILTAHGGSLDLIESPGEGACFKVVIPLEEKR
jgi:signal transduction histidine kinase/FixJ family two-component response regulator